MLQDFNSPKYFPYPLPCPLSFWNIDYKRIKMIQPLFLRQGRKPVTQVMVELCLLDWTDALKRIIPNTGAWVPWKGYTEDCKTS